MIMTQEDVPGRTLIPATANRTAERPQVQPGGHIHGNRPITIRFQHFEDVSGCNLWLTGPLKPLKLETLDWKTLRSSAPSAKSYTNREQDRGLDSYDRHDVTSALVRGLPKLGSYNRFGRSHHCTTRDVSTTSRALALWRQWYSTESSRVLPLFCPRR